MMLTAARTAVLDFSVEPQQQIIGANASRIWLQVLMNDVGAIGFDWIQQLQFYENAFVVSGPNAIVLTLGDIGSALCAPFFGTTGTTTIFPIYVTEIYRL